MVISKLGPLGAYFFIFLCSAKAAPNCMKLFSKAKLSEEDSKLAKQDQKNLGIWRFFYKFSYTDTNPSVPKLLNNPTSPLEPSPSIKEQAKDALALIARATPKSLQHKIPLSIQERMKTPGIDAASGVFKNLLSIMSGRPLYQLYPRYFSKVALGKSMDLNFDKMNYQRILNKMPEDSFTRSHMPITSIEGRFWYSSGVTAAKAAPLVWINSIIQNEVKDENFKNELLANKEKFIFLLTNDYSYFDILTEIKKRTNSANWFKNIRIEDLIKIHKRHQSHNEFVGWVESLIKFESIDSQSAKKLSYFSDPSYAAITPKEFESVISIESQKIAAQRLVLGIDPARFIAWRNSRIELEQEIRKQFKSQSGTHWDKFLNNEALNDDDVESMLLDSPQDTNLIYSAIAERTQLASFLLLGKKPNTSGTENDTIELSEEELGLAQLVNNGIFDSFLLNSKDDGKLSLSQTKWFLTKYLSDLSAVEKQIATAKLTDTEAEIYRTGKSQEILNEYKTILRPR
jgi:hypothetical protein